MGLCVVGVSQITEYPDDDCNPVLIALLVNFVLPHPQSDGYQRLGVRTSNGNKEIISH